MNVRIYARSQNGAWRPVQRLIRALLNVIGVPVREPEYYDFAVRLYQPVVEARELNYGITLRHLDDVAPEVLAPRPRDYPFRALSNTLKGAIEPVRIAGDPVTDDNRADLVVIREVQKAIEGPVYKQIKEPAREVVAHIGEDEKVPYGWARVLVGATSCSFCAMLASRGPVYTSKAAALGRGGSGLGAYHMPYANKNGAIVGGKCDCEAILVPRGSTTWEGHQAHQNLSQLWKDTTAGVSYVDAPNEFRREWEALVHAGKTARFLPESIQPKPAAA